MSAPLLLADYETKYLSFVKEGESPSGKTEIWHVLAKSSGILLGTIKWYGPWRGYAFWPEPDTLYNDGCLYDISNACEIMTNRQNGGRGGS